MSCRRQEIDRAGSDPEPGRRTSFAEFSVIFDADRRGAFQNDRLAVRNFRARPISEIAAQPCKAVAQHVTTHTDLEFLLALTERNVVEQLNNLRTHPTVAERLEQGDLRLHGWLYDLGEGVVTAYDADKAAFLPLHTPITRS